MHYPAHRVLLSELRAFEYGTVGGSCRAKMRARSGALYDTVITLALAWCAALVGLPLPMWERVSLGNQLALEVKSARYGIIKL